MALRLVANPGRVLATAASMWPVYVALLMDAGIKALEWIQNNRELRWQDMVVPLLLIMVPPLRVIYQEALASATERKLQEERMVRQRLEEEATSPSPPLTPNEVKSIKRTAKEKVNSPATTTLKE